MTSAPVVHLVTGVKRGQTWKGTAFGRLFQGHVPEPCSAASLLDGDLPIDLTS